MPIIIIASVPVYLNLRVRERVRGLKGYLWPGLCPSPLFHVSSKLITLFDRFPNTSLVYTTIKPNPCNLPLRAAASPMISTSLHSLHTTVPSTPNHNADPSDLPTSLVRPKGEPGNVMLYSRVGHEFLVTHLFLY
jgi:hypothetical protein